MQNEFSFGLELQMVVYNNCSNSSQSMRLTVEAVMENTKGCLDSG